MSQPPFHTYADDGYEDLQTPDFGDWPLTPDVDWSEVEGVVLFDPETDTSPYARAGKAKKAAKAPGEKPSVKESAKVKAAQITNRAAERAILREQADQARREAAAMASTEPEPEVALEDKPSARRSGLRIVPTDDAAEIRRLAEAQRRTEAAQAAAMSAGEPENPQLVVSAGAEALRQAFMRGLRGQGGKAQGVSDAEAAQEAPARGIPHGTPGNTGAFSSVPAFKTLDVADDGKPSARGGLVAGAAVRSAQAAAGEKVEPILRKRDPETAWRVGLVWVTFMATVIVSLVMLYFPAQELYLALRENERLSHELELNLERNSLMQERVASLQTPEGIQDEAHRVYDLVMPGEHAVQVVGVNYEEPSTVAPLEIPRGSGENTHTWATNLLDRVFGVTGPSTTTAEVQDVATVTEGPAVEGADIVAQGD